MSKSLNIAHLYPDLLNLYADKGNILTLKRRCEWRGVDVTITPVSITDTFALQDYHLVLLGGGSDREQAIIGKTLRSIKDEWRHAVEDGLPLLAICGGYQLLGEYYQLPDGEKVQGLEILDMVTVPGDPGAPRLIGNVAIDSPDCGSIVGFENHGGRTSHSHSPLGYVRSGHGNNGADGQEGVRYKNIVGTYIHGPLLPKNPRVADFVLQLALDYAGIEAELEPLDDRLESAAHDAFLNRRIKAATKV